MHAFEKGRISKSFEKGKMRVTLSKRERFDSRFEIRDSRFEIRESSNVVGQSALLLHRETSFSRSCPQIARVLSIFAENGESPLKGDVFKISCQKLFSNRFYAFNSRLQVGVSLQWPSSDSLCAAPPFRETDAASRSADHRDNGRGAREGSSSTPHPAGVPVFGFAKVFLSLCIL